MISKIIPIIYMLGVLLLILPSFIRSNNNLKHFLINLSIWIVVLLVLLSFYIIYKVLF